MYGSLIVVIVFKCWDVVGNMCCEFIRFKEYNRGWWDLRYKEVSKWDVCIVEDFNILWVESVWIVIFSYVFVVIIIIIGVKVDDLDVEYGFLDFVYFCMYCIWNLKRLWGWIKVLKLL